jgi:hypothetical protein
MSSVETKKNGGRIAYYVKRRDSLLKDFDKVVKHFREAMEADTDSAKIDELAGAIRTEYEGLIPTLPFVGGKKNPFEFNLIGSAWMLALFRVLEVHGYKLRDIGRIVYETYESYIASFPSFYGFFYRLYVYSRFMQRRMRKSARRSQKREFPDDWVFDFVEGVKGQFSYGADFKECAICKFYKKQDAERFLPYLCLGDFAMFHGFGVGMKRTKTLGTGMSHCDFRYVKGHKTPRGWPPEELEEFRAFLGDESVTQL